MLPKTLIPLYESGDTSLASLIVLPANEALHIPSAFIIPLTSTMHYPKLSVGALRTSVLLIAILLPPLLNATDCSADLACARPDCCGLSKDACSTFQQDKPLICPPRGGGCIKMTLCGDNSACSSKRCTPCGDTSGSCAANGCEGKNGFCKSGKWVGCRCTCDPMPKCNEGGCLGRQNATTKKWTCSQADCPCSND